MKVVKKEGLLKRLKNIESENEQQLEIVKDQRDKQLDTIKDYSAKKELEFFDEKNQRSIELINKNKNGNKKVNYRKRLCMHSDGRPYNFNGFKKTENLGNNIY